VNATFFDWLDDRTGYRKFVSVLLLEEIPGGARWRYVWGSTLVFVFSLQLITGILLMTAYSPGDTSAWGSVHFIQYQMDFGWLIRGLHHFGSQTMMVLIALHMLQVVIAGAHLPPREVNWWLGLALLGMTFGMGLTGYLLPWDQKGYWATRVATNIAGNTPMIGDFLKKMLVGGDDYGNHTLTRFYALHVGVLPLTMIVLIIAHIYVFRRQGVTHPPRAEGGEMFWPGQAFRDLVACLVVFGVLVGLVVYGHGSRVVPDDHQAANLYEDWAHAGQKGLGANLDAPADRDTPDYPARPEWYFLFLFQLLKYFEGEQVLIGTFVIPNAAMALLFLLPLLGYGAMRKFGHGVGLVVVIAMLLAVAGLTALAFADDSPEWAPEAAKWLGTLDEKDAADHGADKAREMAQEKAQKKAQDFNEHVKAAEEHAKRAATLAMAGVPDEGARTLLRNDPLTTGHKLFKMHCAVCHAFTPRQGEDDSLAFARNKARKASDLGDYGSKEWIRGLLNDPSDSRYFGGMPQLTGMKSWKKLKVDNKRAQWRAKDPAGADEKIKKQEADFDLIAAWLAEQAVPAPKRTAGLHDKAQPLFEDNCGSCHRVGTFGGEEAPDLTGYCSADWIRGMILAPAHKSRYGRYYDDADNLKGLMPAFANLEGPGAEQALHERNPALTGDMVIQLSDAERECVIRFLQRDYRVVFGGKTIAAAPK
jgi:ubiquinol-cytochrome c reductase cytochrome b subunit